MARGINFKFPFRKGIKGAFQTNDSTIEAIADDLRILLLTNHGERPIHRDFGANLRAIIFEQGTDVNQRVRDSIIAAVDKWMPFVRITIIEVNNYTTDPTLRPNEINVSIEFSVGEIEGYLQQRIRG